MRAVSDLLADRDVLTDVVRTATDLASGDIDVEEIDLDPVPLTNMTTTALGRIRGTITSDGATEPWSIVVKVVQSPDHSPIWDEIPPPMRPEIMAVLPWRTEPDLYRSSFRALLPDGMRMPDVYRVESIDDAHIAIWMEDVAHRPGTWSNDDYGRAGHALGRMWAGSRDGDEDGILVPRDLRVYFFGRITHAVLPALRGDEMWNHPAVAQAADPTLRVDLLDLADATPRILDRLDELPRGATHGDACPQNLLPSTGDPDTFVVIDWQFAALCPVGYDAGQVVAGHAESGDLEPDRLPEVFDSVMDGYVAGLRAEGADVPMTDVRYGAIGTLAVRSAFTAVPLELLSDAPDEKTDRIVADRCRYARFLVDLAATLTT